MAGGGGPQPGPGGAWTVGPGGGDGLSGKPGEEALGAAVGGGPQPGSGGGA